MTYSVGDFTNASSMPELDFEYSTEQDDAMGTLYKRRGNNKYMMAVMVDGRQQCRATRTNNKRVAKMLLAEWEAQVFERRFQLVQSNPPRFDEWVDDFLNSISHANTKKRYGSSIGKLRPYFRGAKLGDISAARALHNRIQSAAAELTRDS